MKALSLSRPWPYTFLHLGDESKRLENRRFKSGRMPPMCKHRGPLLLHAAQSWDPDCWRFVADRGFSNSVVDKLMDDCREVHRAGGIFARCDVVGHVEPQAGDPRPLIVLGEGEVTTIAVNRDRAFAYRAEMHRGVAETVSLGSDLDLRWWMGGYALVFAAVEPTPWVPCRGALGLWEVPAEVFQALWMDGEVTT